MSAFIINISNATRNDPPTAESPAAFVYTIAKLLGLCVPITDYLAWVLDINAIVQIVISLPGIAGAAMSLCVACLKQGRCSLNVQVALLSLYNLVFLSAVILAAILRLTEVEDNIVVGIINGVRQLGMWGVNYTMVDITIERCLSISRPFLARKICGVNFTLKRSVVTLAIGIILSLLFVLDVIFDLSTKADCLTRRTLTTYGVVFSLYISLLLFYLIPFVCILVANGILIHALYHVKENHKQMVPGSSNKQVEASVKQLSLFVVAISVWYCICMLAPSILFLVRLTRVELMEPKRDLVTAVTADTLIVLSTSANFVFYFLMWRHFRNNFLRMFCKRCRGVDLDIKKVESNTLQTNQTHSNTGQQRVSDSSRS